MTFENQDIRVISPMDPQEGHWYIEPMKDEVGRSWDHAVGKQHPSEHFLTQII